MNTYTPNHDNMPSLKKYPYELPTSPLTIRRGTYQGIDNGYFHILGMSNHLDHEAYEIPLYMPFVLVSSAIATGELYPAQYDAEKDTWMLLAYGIKWENGRITKRLPLKGITA